MGILDKANGIKDDAIEYVDKNKESLAEKVKIATIGIGGFVAGYFVCRVKDTEQLAQTMLEASLNNRS